MNSSDDRVFMRTKLIRFVWEGPKSWQYLARPLTLFLLDFLSGRQYGRYRVSFGHGVQGFLDFSGAGMFLMIERTREPFDPIGKWRGQTFWFDRQGDKVVLSVNYGADEHYLQELLPVLSEHLAEHGLKDAPTASA